MKQRTNRQTVCFRIDNNQPGFSDRDIFRMPDFVTLAARKPYGERFKRSLIDQL